MAEADPLKVAGADPVSATLAHLRANAEVTGAFGGLEHVSGMIEAPWPRLRVSAGPGGSLRNLRWDTAPEILLEAFSDPSGWPGHAELRRMIMLAAAALVRLPDQDPEPGGPVVSLVQPSGALAVSDLTAGGFRYSLTLQVVIHP